MSESRAASAVGSADDIDAHIPAARAMSHEWKVAAATSGDKRNNVPVRYDHARDERLDARAERQSPAQSLTPEIDVEPDVDAEHGERNRNGGVNP